MVFCDARVHRGVRRSRPDPYSRARSTGEKPFWDSCSNETGRQRISGHGAPIRVRRRRRIRRTPVPCRRLRLVAAYGRSGEIEHSLDRLCRTALHAGNLSGNRDALRACEAAILNKHAVPAIRAALVDTYADDARADLALSRVLFRMERYDEGEAVLRDVRPIDSTRALYHFMLGNFAVKRRDADADAAAVQYSLSLLGDPAFAPAHNNLGVIAATQGRRRQSLEHFLKAARLRGGYADAKRNLEALQEGRVADLRYTMAPLRAVLRPE